MNYGAAASGSGKGYSSVRPAWATEDRRAQGRPTSPDPEWTGAQTHDEVRVGELHDAAWKEEAIKFCQNCYSLCETERYLQDFNRKVASGEFNWMIEVEKALVTIREEGVMTWTLSESAELWLREFTTGDSQIFCHRSPFSSKHQNSVLAVLK